MNKILLVTSAALACGLSGCYAVPAPAPVYPAPPAAYAAPPPAAPYYAAPGYYYPAPYAYYPAPAYVGLSVGGVYWHRH